MIELIPHTDGVLLPVRAQPGGRRNVLQPPVDGYLKVMVTQVAEKGKANEAIAKLLAKTLKLRRSQFELISGATSKFKTFLVRDVTVAELETRVAEAITR